MRRRAFLAGGLGWKPEPRILLRNLWQTENIGDIAHGPGFLAVAEKYVPEARVTLVPSRIDREVKALIEKRFPQVEVTEPLAETDLDAVMERCDLMVYGSGAGVTPAHLALWQRLSRKPSGVFGQTVSVQKEAVGGELTQDLKAVLDRAAFIFTRETTSLANIRMGRVTAKTMAFVPDSTFSCDLRDEGAAERYLKAAGLAGERFIAVIPRLRYTPYHEFRKVAWTQGEIARRVAVNNRTKEEDAAKLREVVVAWVRKTGGKALLCAEMTYQLGIIGPLLYDPLPDDVKKKVVARKEYWMPSEAASVYRRAEVVVSSECHSPILAVVNGTPCVYVRQREDTIKGQMWADLGLGEWAPRIEETSGAALAELVLGIGARRDGSRRMARAAVEKAHALHKWGAEEIRRVLAAGTAW